MIKILPPVEAEIQNHHITINDNFGNTNVNGLQHKGAIKIKHEAYFAKLDDLNPTVNGHWENHFDFQYSSVSEAISSILIKNINSKQNFDSVEYQFATFNINGKQSTGTISKNYLRENESERVLALGRNFDPHTLITTDEYADEIIDVSNQKRFNRFIKYFTDHNVPYEHTKSFLIQQAAFDIMTGNTDRLRNPSNFIIAYNNKDRTGRLVNFDYGRTLPLPLLWTTKSESTYDMDWLDDDLTYNIKNFVHNNDSILSNMSNNETLKFLKENGFKPFEIDINNLKKDLNDLNQVIQQSDVAFKKFATVKIKSFEAALESPFIKNFYIKKTPSKTKTIDFSQSVVSNNSETKTPTININKELIDKVDKAVAQIRNNNKDLELEQ